MSDPSPQSSTHRNRCPRCNVLLAPGYVGGLEVEECATCKGMFVTHERVRAMHQVPESQELDLGEKARVGVDGDNAVLACPRCTQPLERRFVSRSNAYIDVCWVDGAWFDRGELEQIELARATKTMGTTPQDFLASLLSSLKKAP